MRYLKCLLVTLWLFLAGSAYAVTWFQCDGSTFCGSGTTNYSGSVAAGISVAGSPTGTTVWRWTYPIGYPGGEGCADVYPASTMPGGVTELWGQWYYMYSSNFRYHGSGDKQMYFQPSNVQGTIIYGSYPGGEMDMEPQGGSAPGQTVWTYPPNQGATVGGRADWYLEPGTWHKYKAHYVGNTGSAMNGIYQLWIDDILVSNWSNVYYGPGNFAFSSGGVSFTVIWGGMGQTLDRTQYLYMTGIYLGSTDPGGSTADTLAPYADGYSPAKGATGVDNTNRVVLFHVKDNRTNDTGVVASSGVVNINGTNYTCAVGLTCSGTSGDITVSYTKPTNWASGQIVTVSISGFQDAAGNVMATDTYSYTIAPAVPVALNILTTTLPAATVGMAYTAPLSAEGGTFPYVWSLLSGTLPAGLAVPSSGTGSWGVPTTTGVSNFTLKVVDSVGATDNQAVTLSVNQASPGGQYTVNIPVLSDCYTNSGSPTTNTASDNITEIYVFPVNTVANRSYDNVSLSLVPGNSVITSAKLRKYLIGHEGSGGSNPMRVYSYRVVGLPSIGLVTWANDNSTLQPYGSVADVALTTGWYEFDVTNAAQWAYSNGSNLLSALDGGNDGVQDTNRQFASVEYPDASLRPYLVVNYTVLGDVPPGQGRMKIKSGVFRNFR